MIETLSDLVDVNEGGECWIFGKGPSLAEFLKVRSDFDGFGIGINQAAFLVPCKIFMCMDEACVDEYVPKEWPDGMIALCHRHVLERIPQARGIHWSRIKGKGRWRGRSFREWAEMGYMYADHSTVVSAVWAAAMMGSTLIRFVGIDGCGGYGMEYEGDKSRWGSSGYSYMRAKELAYELAANLGVEAVAWN